MRFTRLSAALLFVAALTNFVDLQQVFAAPKGVALAVGLNKVSPAHYGGWSGDLFACENDARDMAAIAKSQGYESKLLLTDAATRMAVLSGIRTAADQLVSGDIFLLSYSGHGGQVYDENGDEKSNGPNDVLDETWCLFDGQVIDDELYAAYRRFKPGVRILVFSDSCHSGTVARVYQLVEHALDRSPIGLDFPIRSRSETDLATFFMNFDKGPRVMLTPRDTRTGPPPLRLMPGDVARRTWSLHREEYKKIGLNPELGVKNLHERGDEGEIAAYGLLFGGCQDNQLSKDGWLNGAFTGAVKDAWTVAIPQEIKNYRAFHQAILKRFSTDPTQTPNYYPFGQHSTPFETQKPFSIQ